MVIIYHIFLPNTRIFPLIPLLHNQSEIWSTNQLHEHFNHTEKSIEVVCDNTAYFPIAYVCIELRLSLIVFDLFIFQM